jgi:hypothetical protein
MDDLELRAKCLELAVGLVGTAGNLATTDPVVVASRMYAWATKDTNAAAELPKEPMQVIVPEPKPVQPAPITPPPTV